jgi:hypothetical protein
MLILGCMIIIFTDIRVHDQRSLETTALDYWLKVTTMGCYHTKRPMQLQPYSDILCSLSEFIAFPIHTSEFSVLAAADI